MRKYIVIALVLLVGGIAASIYLIPSGSEVAILQATDVKTVDLGNVDIEAEYNQGRRTFPIINALADKRVAEGNRPAAIKLLEEYVTANPADMNGRKKLADQYLAAADTKGYYSQLQAIAAAEPTEENLKALSYMYNGMKDYVKQMETLKRLVELTKGEKPQYFEDLANVQLVNNDTDGALKTVMDLKAKHPNYTNYAMARIMVSVLVSQGKVDEAYAAAKEWMDKTTVPTAAAPVASGADGMPLPPVAGAAPQAPAADGRPAPVAQVATADDKPRQLADFCNILHYSGHADKAIALVEPHLAMLDHSPELVLAYVNANITSGKTDNAYAVLKKMDDSGQMIAALYPPYLGLTLKREDTAAAEVIAAKLDAMNFTEEQALNTLEIARIYSAKSVLDILAKRFGEATVIDKKPVLAAVIAILTNDTTQDTKIETALNTELTSTQRLRLAESCARAKKTACFDAIVKQYPPLEQMSPVQVSEYAQLFIIADRAPELVEPVGKLAAAEHAAAGVVTAHRRLAAASGRLDVLKPWLEMNADKVTLNQLQELFYLANDRHHAELASDLAERLYARDPSPMNRDIMIAAYVGAESYAKALPLLREQMKDGGANDGVYLSTLSKLAHKDAAIRKELADYAQAALQSDRGDDRQKLNYVYIMINNGRKQEAIPFAKAYAASKGGEWKKLYAQLTAKPKAGVTGAPAVKLTREQMVAVANSPTISAANKRQMAFSLLNDGYKAEATAVFKDLAKDKGPDSQEVKDLMYMWGGKLGGEQLAWVQMRAKNASAYDKDRWAEMINNTADDTNILAYVSATPDALYNRALRQKYFRVLASTNSRENYEVAMRNWVSHTTDVPALLDYASTAQSYGYTGAAVNGYERVLVLDADNAKALSQLAALDFGKGKFSSADQRLNHYIATQRDKPDAESNPAQAHFYKAQLLLRQGKKAEANAEFAYVVQLASQLGASTPDALSRVYSSQFHLGQHAQAKAGFEQLLEQYPNDKGILADYMSALIEFNYLEDATRVANQYDKTSPYYRKGSMLIGRSANTASVQKLSNGREMKITFSQPIAGKPPIDVVAARKLAWVESSQVNYDSVSISAKPGYVVRYMPTSNEQFAVVAAPNYSMQAEAQRQQDLRLQMLYARIEQQSGQEAKAAQRLAVLEHYYPNEPMLLSYKASVESARGNTDQAMDLINRARSVAPENEDFSLQAQNIRRVDTGTSYAKLDHQYRALGDNSEQITTLSGVLRQGRTEFGVTAQNDFVQTENTRRGSDGAVGDYDATRQRGELFVAQNYDNGARSQASLYANNKSVGAGLSYAFNNPLGRTELIGEYQRPYWDFVEAVYEHTTRDRVGVKHFSVLQPGTSLGAELSYNNYNTDVRDDVAETTLLRLNLMQEIQPQTKDQPYLGVGYGFDGEYRNGKPHASVDAFGADYYTLPVRTREVHALTGIYRNDWGADTHALFVGGMAYDRINGGVSPLAEARIDHDIDVNWQVGARARYAVETNNTDNNALDLGADVLYKF